MNSNNHPSKDEDDHDHDKDEMNHLVPIISTSNSTDTDTNTSTTSTSADSSNNDNDNSNDNCNTNSKDINMLSIDTNNYDNDHVNKSDIMKEADRIIDSSVDKKKKKKKSKINTRNSNYDDYDSDDYDYDYDNDDYFPNFNTHNNSAKRHVMTCILGTILTPIAFYYLTMYNYNNRMNQLSQQEVPISNTFPEELIGDFDTTTSRDNVYVNDKVKSSKSEGVYSFTDFRNEDLMTVPYWEEVLTKYDIPTDDEYYYNNYDYNDDEEDDIMKDFSEETYDIIETSKSKSTNESSSSSSFLRKNNDTNINSNSNNNNNNNNDKNRMIPHLGPCYLPKTKLEMDNIQWKKLIQKNYNKSHAERNITYPTAFENYNPMLVSHNKNNNHKNNDNKNSDQMYGLANYCRPGFIIIGAGKCGTSSLYHYLIGHDRIAPARKKQIHYFKYFTKRPMSWYLSHFYKAEDFLSSGSLMTGEASPGYLPYPDVARRLQVYMNNKAGNGYNQPVDIPKIITIVRNPLERSYSSYNYNYIQPNLANIKQDVARYSSRFHLSLHHDNHKNNDNNNIKDKVMKKNKDKVKKVSSHKDDSESKSNSGISPNNPSAITQKQDQHNKMIENIISMNMTDEQIIQNYFFSFEELIEAEMKELKKCLKRGGEGEKAAKSIYGSKAWAQHLFQQRQNYDENNNYKGSNKKKKSIPLLVSLDESCYGYKVSNSVPKPQFKELIASYPNKLINVKNLILVQSLLGRSLYSLPLEWWYGLYPEKDLHVVCNEDLKYNPSETMSDVTEFLGLPEFNFDSVVNEGMYNVGGNEGYNKITSWDKVEDDDIEDTNTAQERTSAHEKTKYEGIPISNELKKRYLSFVKPYNERLFELAGKRCNW